MLTLLGSLLGFTTSFLPSVLDFFTTKQKHQQEIEKLRVQMELDAKRAELKIVELDARADIEESKGIYQHDRTLDGGNFVYSLRASVRPVITYAFFLRFCFVEISAYLALTASGISGLEALNAVWDEDTKALFAAVIAFWFGGRAINRARK